MSASPNSFQSHVTALSDIIWELFLPFMLILAIYIGYKCLFVIKGKTTRPSGMTFRQFLGPTSISLGAMVGTGAIIGILGALNKYAASGQHYIEAIVFWTLIGCIVMLPLSYAETLFSKTMNKTPASMINLFLGRRAAIIYSLAFVCLYVFGFGGFQFSGISSILSMMSEQYLKLSFDTLGRYLVFVIPLVLITVGIVLLKKHEVFINSMAGMIGSAVLLYFVFFIIFIANTADYLPVFFSNMLIDIKNPVTMATGIPLGILLALQRIAQTAECGIGGLSMAAHENDSKPRAAAIISVIPVILTIFVAIIITTYISSYGIHIGSISLPSDDYSRLQGLFNTVYIVTGNFGLIVLALFTFLSGATTLLGSYYYVKVLLYKNSENKNIFIFFLLILSAGTLSTFGFSIVFDIVDMLIFLVTGLFVISLAIYAKKGWKHYILPDNKD